MASEVASALFATPRMRAASVGIVVAVVALLFSSVRWVAPAIDWCKVYTRYCGTPSALSVRPTAAAQGCQRGIFTPLETGEVGGLGAFVRDLRTGIPPVMGILEWVAARVGGDLGLLARVAYWLALTGAFGLAAAGFRRSWRGQATSLGLSILFLTGTSLVHPGNPQLYDILFPLWMLGFFVTWAHMRGLPPDRRRAWLAVCAGSALTLAELTRPFMVLVVPFLALAWWWDLRPIRRDLIAFVLPVALVSGLWHVKLLALNGGQIAWSNYGGYNLQNAWPMVPLPNGLEQKDAPPVCAGCWANVNTAAVNRNSGRIMAATLRWMVGHPVRAVRHALRRVGAVLAVRVDLMGYRPRHPALIPYRLAVWFALTWIGVQFWLGIGTCLRQRRLAPICTPGGALVTLCVFVLLVVSLGERGEEARFVVAMLPLLAALPTVGWSVCRADCV